MFLSTFRANPHGWIIVGILFLALSFSFSARMALPVLIAGWEEEFKWSRSFLSGGASLIMIVMGSVAPFAGNLLDKFGPRFLVAGGMILSGLSVAFTSVMADRWEFIAIFCIVAAIGYGLISLPVATATIARHFEKDRGLAISIGNSGVGGGQLIFIPLLGLAVTEVGWRPTLGAFGLVIAVLGVASLFVLDNRLPSSHSGADRDRVALSMGGKLAFLLRSPIFWLLGGAYFICGFTTAGVVKVHLIPYARSCGFDLTTGANAMGILAGFDMVGMLIAGYLTDRVHRPGLLGSVYFLRALTFIMLFFFTDNVALVFIFAILFGTLDFATVPPTAGLVASHLGINTMGLTMGIMFAGHSLGGAIGSYTGGVMFDLMARYDWVWIIALALALLAAVLAWSVPEKREPARDDAAPAAAAA